MFAEAVWQELNTKEQQFQHIFNGERCDYVPSWYYHGELGQIRPEILIAQKDKQRWLNNQLDAVKTNVEEALDSASLFYPLIEMFSLYGTHYMDILFGAEVKWHEGQFWSKEVEYPVAKIECPDFERVSLMKETIELARWIKEQTKGQFLISMPDIGCPLNIAINLFGERFLLELALEPESAKRALNIIAKAIYHVHELLIKAVGQETLRCHNAYYVYTPYDYAGLSICSTQMVSPPNFAHIVANADDASVPTVYKGMIQHICGKSSQHIEELSRRKRIKGLQLNDAGADDFEAYWQGLREDQIFYVCPTEKMPLEKVLSITGGKRLVLMGKLEERIPA